MHDHQFVKYFLCYKILLPCLCWNIILSHHKLQSIWKTMQGRKIWASQWKFSDNKCEEGVIYRCPPAGRQICSCYADCFSWAFSPRTEHHYLILSVPHCRSDPIATYQTRMTQIRHILWDVSACHSDAFACFEPAFSCCLNYSGNVWWT